jgi:hypothetical protein
MIPYRQLKAPEAEMTRLAHNDYLQQGSDSGGPGMLLYAVVRVRYWSCLAKDRGSRV